MSILFKIVIVDDENTPPRLMSEPLAKRGYRIRPTEERFGAITVVRSSLATIAFAPPTSSSRATRTAWEDAGRRR